MSFAKHLSAVFAATMLAVAPLGVMLVPTLAHAEETAAAPATPAAPAADAAATPAADAATAPAAAPAAEGAEMKNKMGLESLWEESDVVGKSVLLIMIVMSMGTWYILVTKLFEQHKLMGQAKQAQDSFWSAGSIKAGVETLQEGGAFRYIAETAQTASEHHEGALLEQIDRNTWVTMSIQRAMESVQNRLQDGLAFLATVGSVSPFIGLFGTVWGIYHALIKISQSGQPGIDKVAGPVGEALVMTAFGLAVAVPAVLFYNWLVRRNKSAMEKVRAFGADLHNVLMSGNSAKRG